MPSDSAIPLFPLGLVLLPHMPLPLHIFEERYKSMIAECLKKNTRFGIVFFDGSDIRMVGCTAKILKVLKRYSDGRLDILTQGEARFVIKEMYDRKPYLEGRVNYFDDEPEVKTGECQNLARNGIAMLKQFTTITEMQDAYGFTEGLDNKSLSFVIAGFEGFSNEEKQRFLEMSSTYNRLGKSVASLERIIERTKLTTEIRKIIGGNGDIANFSLKSTKIH
jgi:Lon protease-like protein